MFSLTANRMAFKQAGLRDPEVIKNRSSRAKTRVNEVDGGGRPLGIDAAVRSRDIPESTVERR
jgi:hypothetical protein